MGEFHCSLGFSEMFVLLLALLPGLIVLAEEDLTRWANDDLEVIRTATPENGKPLVIAARLKSEQTRTECKIWFPPDINGNQVYFLVMDGIVYDENNMAVDFIEAWDEGNENTCGIKILEKSDEHEDSDHWNSAFGVMMTLDGNGLFGQDRMHSIDAAVHIKDDLLTNVRDFLHPINYNLSLVPDLLSSDPSTHFTGNMKITLKCISPSMPIAFLHMDGLNIKQIHNGTIMKYPDSDAEEFGVFSLNIDLQRGVYSFFTNAYSFDEGDILTLDIDFEANLEPTEHGLGLYKKPCTDGSEKFCWFTQFESTFARRAFPCIDEPNMKATFAIQDYAGVKGDNNVTVWANQKDVDAGLADYIADVGPRLVDFFGSTFGIQYNMPKMDMVSCPARYGPSGAMENWGLLLYGSDTLLYDQQNPDFEKKWWVLNVVAHEVAHQWFGNLVTMDWWDQIWLNEGFATYLSHVGSEAMDPDMDSWAWMVTVRMLNVMKEDSTEASYALSDSVSSRRDIGRKFTNITYSKGASFIRMMEAILGFSTLIKGLSSYVADLQFSNSREEDLFLHLEVAALEDGKWPQGDMDSFEETMKMWSNQAGYPLVSAEKVAEDVQSYLKLTQSWYTDVPMDTTKMWDIPINMVIAGDADTNWDDTAPSVWLSEESTMIPIGEDTSSPIILNKKAMGYFRINYDDENWLRIATTLKTDRQAIHPLNRAQIICDVIALTRTGHVNQEIHDAIMEYIDMETDFAPLNAAKECAQENRLFQMEDRI